MAFRWGVLLVHWSCTLTCLWLVYWRSSDLALVSNKRGWVTRLIFSNVMASNLAGRQACSLAKTSTARRRLTRRFTVKVSLDACTSNIGKFALLIALHRPCHGHAGLCLVSQPKIQSKKSDDLVCYSRFIFVVNISMKVAHTVQTQPHNSKKERKHVGNVFRVERCQTFLHFAVFLN